ncbi:hypothetical protein A1D29_09860 [Pasteurellaceae bacterium Orientalotternb1]|nr:hypothetical protein A1D29_09860 [Pasteurellaceae bacterium Orientalotternb1]
MKHLSKLVLSVLTVFSLTACGGGGGDSGTGNNSSAALPDIIQVLNNSTGRAVVFTNNGATRQSLVTNTDFRNYIEVDGQKIRIFPQAGASDVINGVTWVSEVRMANRYYEAEYHCCSEFDSAVFGVVEEGPYKNTYLYYNGLPSQSIPTSGQAQYKGSFVLSADNPAFEKADYYLGAAMFSVDFGAKKLNGELTHVGFQPIKLSAVISGNSFAGSAESPQLPTQAALEGKFYGENAKQLAGFFEDTKDTWGGAFGAAKQ